MGYILPLLINKDGNRAIPPQGILRQCDVSATVLTPHNVPVPRVRGVNANILKNPLGKLLYIAPIAELKKSNFCFGYSYQIIINEILVYSTVNQVLITEMAFFQGLSNHRCT